jgi:cyclophilin family peptidyl-prolyl cis-trans isomerase
LLFLRGIKTIIMKYLKLTSFLLLTLFMWSCTNDKPSSVKGDSENKLEVKKDAKSISKIASKEKAIVKEDPSQGVFAIVSTDKGDVKIKLAYQRAPVTVANFVALAEGNMENNLRGKGEPFYDGLNFHRVISKHNGDPQDFMIQGGCPQMNGSGNPGYKFQDEFHLELRHNKPGTLSMANSGPKTNGSQFFITVTPTPHLDRRHSVFGYVIEGLDVVTNKIKKGDSINSIKIERVGDNAQNFDAMAIFNERAQVVKR